MSILDKARAGQGFLEQIANAIPGFKGYREKELRRDADRIEREHLAGQLEECKKGLNTIANDGTYVAPRLVRGFIDSEGELVDAAPAETREVITPDVAAEMQRLMRAVVCDPSGTGELGSTATCAAAAASPHST